MFSRHVGPGFSRQRCLSSTANGCSENSGSIYTHRFHFLSLFSFFLTPPWPHPPMSWVKEFLAKKQSKVFTKFIDNAPRNYFVTKRSCGYSSCFEADFVKNEPRRRKTLVFSDKYPCVPPTHKDSTDRIQPGTASFICFIYI